ncbi:MAG: RNase adapter RapZ, partial [Myxococcota bacterium]
DNLPPQLIETLLTLADSAGGQLRRIALVVDAREAGFLGEFGPAWDRLRAADHDLTLLFFDCSDEVLVNRFKETRRRHPLEQGDGILAAIARERSLLRELSERADEVVPTQHMSVHGLKRHIVDHFAQRAVGQSKQVVTLMSFGFKHGLPPELDLCFDVRFLPTPHFIPERRPRTGLADEVYDFVVSSDDARGFLEKTFDLLSFLLPRYTQEGKSYLTVAIGCTGGRHRSVALTCALAERLRDSGVSCRVAHRDAARTP